MPPTTSKPDPLAIACIARITHEANRAYCVTLGDFSQPEWNSAPEWQRSSAFTGVRKILEGEITLPEQSHESWMAQKQAEGWVYGSEKDPEAKTHPCMVPFDMLKPAQQQKDRIFFAIVRSFMHIQTPTADAIADAEGIYDQT